MNSPSVRFRWSVLPALLAMSALTAHAAADPKHEDNDKKEDAATKSLASLHLSDEMRVTQGSASIGGKKTPYQAEAGVMVVYLHDPQDDDPPQPAEGEKPPPQPPEVGMSYVAYFKGDKPDRTRPITFLFNGGPGSSSVWLHMGAFGPKRVRTTNDSHSPAAPYRVVDNEYSLLDVSDLVFIDAPGTGFGHLRGADKDKAFWGVDPDAHTFANFIVEFLSRHGRWNSPKYLFGESYGTTRAAVLAYQLQNDKSLDLNGVIFLSQILCFDNSADAPQFNPSVDQPYVLALPTYAATAWYHKKLPNQPPELAPLLREVEQFAIGEYAAALMAGPRLPAEQQHAIAVRLHNYTGLPVDYIERASLRINVGEFNKTLLGDELTAGRLDTRFSGPTLDPMSKEAEYDPQAVGDLVGVRLGVQRLRAQHAAVRRSQDLQGRHSGVADVGLPASAAGLAVQDSGRDQRDAGPRERDEAEPESQGADERRLLRSGDAVLCGGLRVAAAADSALAPEQHRDALLSVRAHGVRARRRHESAARQRRGVYREERRWWRLARSVAWFEPALRPYSLA